MHVARAGGARATPHDVRDKSSTITPMEPGSAHSHKLAEEAAASRREDAERAAKEVAAAAEKVCHLS